MTLSSRLVKSRSSFHQGPLWWNGHWFLSLHQGPLRWNGHWFFLCLHQGPLQWNGHWIFLCLHQGPLRWNGHWFSYIMALSDGMVIDFLLFTARSSPMEWSFISFFTSRPSPMEWSLISLSHQGPLQWNGHWFLCHIKALSNGMVIDFCHIKTLSYGMVESCFYFPYLMTLLTELVIAPVSVGFYSSSSSLKLRQNWCLYLYLSFTAIIWKCHIFILSNKI